MAGYCDPGWSGSKLTLELQNARALHPVELWPGMRIGQLVFHVMSATPAEDYSVVGHYNFDQQVTGLFFFLGVNPPEAESMPTNHSPYFYIDDAALDNGVKAFVSLVEEFSVDFNKTN